MVFFMHAKMHWYLVCGIIAKNTRESAKNRSLDVKCGPACLILDR